MNQIHVLLSIHNIHNQIYGLLFYINVLLRHESDTCITVYT